MSRQFFDGNNKCDLSVSFLFWNREVKAIWQTTCLICLEISRLITFIELAKAAKNSFLFTAYLNNFVNYRILRHVDGLQPLILLATKKWKWPNCNWTISTSTLNFKWFLKQIQRSVSRVMVWKAENEPSLWTLLVLLNLQKPEWWYPFKNG